MTAAALTIDVDGPTPILSIGKKYAQHTSTMSQTMFGINRGLPRMLRVLDEEGVKATFFVPGWVAEQHPGLAADLLSKGHEVANHSYAHRPPTTMSDDEQRLDFELAMDVFQRQDIPIAGYRAANWQSNQTTCELVAEYGLYDSSLMHDDRPYRVDTASGSFVELPTRWSLDDWEQFAFAPEPHVGSLLRAPNTVLRSWCDAFDACARHGSLFVLTLHPELTGHADRAEALRQFIVHALAKGAEFVRCGDLAAKAAADPTLPVRPITPPPTSAWPS